MPVSSVESAGGNPPDREALQEPLLNAAKLLRQWVAAQQSAWPGRAPVASRTAIPTPQFAPSAPLEPPAAVFTPVASEASVELPSPIEQEASLAQDEPPSTERPVLSSTNAAFERPIFGSILIAAPPDESIGGEVRTSLRWGLRGLAAAACLAIVAFAATRGAATWTAWRTAPPSGAVVIESTPPGSTVLVDGTPVGATPLTANLAPGAHRVEFRRGGEARTVAVDVADGRSTPVRFDWSRVNVGRLQVLSEPAGATVLIDGRPSGVTPLTVDAVPTGTHAIELQSERGSVRREVTIDERNVAVVSEAIYSGWVHVSSPIELSVSEGPRSVTLDERNQALLPPGPHDLRFENRVLRFSATRHVDIAPGETTRIVMDPPRSRITITGADAAEVLIDGQRAGETPLVDHPVAIGTRDVTVRNGLAQRHFVLTVTTAPTRLNVEFDK